MGEPVERILTSCGQKTWPKRQCDGPTRAAIDDSGVELASYNRASIAQAEEAEAAGYLRQALTSSNLWSMTEFPAFVDHNLYFRDAPPATDHDRGSRRIL